MTSAAKSSPPARASYFSRVKHELENQHEALRDLEGWDHCDERFVAPSLLNKDGSLNLSVLFDFNISRPADRRYVLRQMETAREQFLDKILVASRRRKEEERRREEEAADAKEMRLLKERLRNVSGRLEHKMAELDEHVKVAETRAEQEERNRARESEATMWEQERRRVAALEKRAEELPPDFPTTFSVCARLHASPRRATAAAAVHAEKSSASRSSTHAIAVSSDGVDQTGEDDEMPSPVSSLSLVGAAGSAGALASARRRQQEMQLSASSPLVRIGFDVSKRGGMLVPITQPLLDL